MFTRKVLFKAKSKNDGKWIKGLPHIEGEKAYMICVYPGTSARSYTEEIDPDTLCEYTNKNTESDKYIYENDLFLHDGKYWKVTYSPELCGFQGVFEEKRTGFQFILPLFHFTDAEPAGNAVDNPELVNTEFKT